MIDRPGAYRRVSVGTPECPKTEPASANRERQVFRSTARSIFVNYTRGVAGIQRATGWALIFIPALAIAQICALGPNAAGYKQTSDQRPSPDALQLARRTDAAAGKICGTNCPQIVLYRNATAPNLMLLVDAGRAKIVYSSETFARIYEKHGDPGIIALLAHEIGHALDDTLGAAWIEKSWTPELRADAWAGCVLAKNNLSAGDLSHATAALGEYPSPAHPAWTARLPVIRSGYMHCGGALWRDAAFPAR